MVKYFFLFIYLLLQKLLNLYIKQLIIENMYILKLLVFYILLLLLLLFLLIQTSRNKKSGPKIHVIMLHKFTCNFLFLFVIIIELYEIANFLHYSLNSITG